MLRTTVEPLPRERREEEEEAVGSVGWTRRGWLLRLVGHEEFVQADTYRKLVAELWGTFLLVFVGIGTLLTSLSSLLYCTNRSNHSFERFLISSVRRAASQERSS